MRLTIIALLFIAISASATESSPSWKFSTPKNEAWKTAFEQKRGREYMTEQTQGGEKIDAWTQLITKSFRALPKEKFHALVELTLSGLKRGCPSFQATMIKNTPESVVFRWSDEGCGGFAPQEAVMRIDYFEGGALNLQYAYYKSKSKPDFEQWIKVVTDAEKSNETP